MEGGDDGWGGRYAVVECEEGVEVRGDGGDDVVDVGAEGDGKV